MRLVLAALLLLLPTTTLAQTETESNALFFLDVGPGFFTALDDTTDRSGVTTFAGFGGYLGSRVALSGRVNFTQLDEKTVASSIWGWLTYTFGSTGPGPYISAGAGYLFGGDGIKVAGRGGYQIALFGEDAMAFLEAEGRYVNEDEVNAAGIANVGMRFNWGHR